MAVIGRPADPANADRLATTVRIDRATADRLMAEASRRCVSRNLIIERAIVEWLDRAESADLPTPTPPEHSDEGAAHEA